MPSKLNAFDSVIVVAGRLVCRYVFAFMLCINLDSDGAQQTHIVDFAGKT